jgi:solute carrier family 32 (vesicular inhibitory amino acid transporter)
MGDHLHTLIPAVSAATHMILVSLVSMVPTIFLRTPALLSYLSMVGTVATIAVVLTVVSAGLLEGDVVDHDAAASAAGLTTEPTVMATDAVLTRSSSSSQHHCNWDANGLPLAFGLVVFCFSGHAIVPNIYTSMQEPHRFDYMVSLTFAIVAVCSLAVGSAGYYMFGDTVADQVTLSLEQHSQATTAMTALTWLMVLTGSFVPFCVCVCLSCVSSVVIVPIFTDCSLSYARSLLQGHADHVPLGTGV